MSAQKSNPLVKVTLGGWFQRTTLHLSEVYGFLSSADSKLELSKEKLKDLHLKFNIESVSRESGYLEYIKAKTKYGIEIRYFEDGLYILEITYHDLELARKALTDFYEEVFNPSISYLFSLGAPTPKELANIKSTHPIAITVRDKGFKIDDNTFGKIYSKIISKDFTVYKTEKYIFIVSSSDKDETVSDLVEMQIFFREFKDQLEKYLNIHRKIWEEIAEIKERRFIKGNEVEKLRSKLDSYQKTINLISSRIDQMDTYVKTRSSISRDIGIEKELTTLFQYKFESLSDTHEYIKDIWAMTKDYINSSIEVINDIQNKSVKNSITSLQVITSIGVVSGLIGYLTQESLPEIKTSGIIYLGLLLIIIFPLNFLVEHIFKNSKYKLNFPEKTSKL